MKIMISRQTSLSALPPQQSIIYPNCYDVFNCWNDLVIRKNRFLQVSLGFKIFDDLGERCVLVDRYGFCVTNHLTVENMPIVNDIPIWCKITNNTNKDIHVPHGAILCQIMRLPIDMVGR
jgi:hypothetical protein